MTVGAMRRWDSSLVLKNILIETSTRLQQDETCGLPVMWRPLRVHQHTRSRQTNTQHNRDCSLFLCAAGLHDQFHIAACISFSGWLSTSFVGCEPYLMQIPTEKKKKSWKSAHENEKKTSHLFYNCSSLCLLQTHFRLSHMPSSFDWDKSQTNLLLLCRLVENRNSAVR